MDVTFIGSGKVASFLARALDNSGHAVRRVFSRKKINAEKLADLLYDAQVQTTLDFSNVKTSLFIIAVPDDSIGEVSKELVLPNGAFLVHTSGTKSIEILNFAAASQTGVLYPLQTFSYSRKIDLSTVPFLIEGSDKEMEKTLIKIAGSLSDNLQVVTSEKRKIIHLGAVFASNFTNHMLTVSQELMEKHDLPFDLLKPLIIETMNKAMEIGPGNSQTGPAKREDLQILDQHMEMIEDEEIREIYRLISQNILDHYS